jgi:two-component system OmpR family response regulator
MINTSEHSHQSAYSYCVLLVDDDDQVRQMFSLALKTAGFDVVAAGTQQQAQLRLEHSRPDALVLNLQRSEADGLDVLRRLRARPDLSDVPIVFLAGCASEDLRVRAIRAGADWFGLRPLAMIELKQRISQLVRGGRPPLQLFVAGARTIGSRRLKPTG